ncbi:MAG: TolC family outer membrane protein [Magnetococcales bacterium]|nr:TolC family outer membrane protein [Magnetococcales bacterium]MBF0347094.1 TolC family outer membrane protein [Magnetococcales bacterium]
MEKMFAMQRTVFRWKVVLVLFLVGWPQTTLLAEETTSASFKGLLTRTLEHNPQIRDVREKLNAAMALVPQARSQLLPSVSLEWDNTLASSQWKGGSSQSDPTSATVSLSQDLFNLEAIRDYRRVEPYVKAAQMDLEGVRQKVFLEFVELVTSLVQGRDVLELSEKNHELTRSHWDATRIRFEAGELTQTDVSQSLARVYAAKAGWISAKADLQSSRARLMELAAEEIPERIEVPLIQLDLVRSPLAELSGLLEKRPDMEAERLRVQAEQSNVEARKAGYLPTASLSSSGTRTWDPASGVSGPEEDVSMTVKLSWPLYSGGLTNAQVEEAVAKRESRQAMLERLRLSALRELKVALLDYEKNEAVDQANEVRVTAAKDAMDGVSKEYQVGTRTSLDLLDAQNEFFAAETEKVKSRHGLNLSRFRVLGVLGMLSLEKLESLSVSK